MLPTQWAAVSRTAETASRRRTQVETRVRCSTVHASSSPATITTVLSSCSTVGETTNGGAKARREAHDRRERQAADHPGQRGVAGDLDALGHVGQDDEDDQQDDLGDQWPAVPLSGVGRVEQRRLDEAVDAGEGQADREPAGEPGRRLPPRCRARHPPVEVDEDRCAQHQGVGHPLTRAKELARPVRVSCDQKYGYDRYRGHRRDHHNTSCALGDATAKHSLDPPVRLADQTAWRPSWPRRSSSAPESTVRPNFSPRPRGLRNKSCLRTRSRGKTS